MPSSNPIHASRPLPRAWLAVALASSLGLLGAGPAPSLSAAPPAGSTAADLPRPSQIADDAVIDALARHETPAVIVKFRGSADLSKAAHITDRAARARHVYEQLTQVTQARQAATVQRLTGRFRLREAAGDFRPLWIANALSIRALTPALLAELEASPDVESVMLEELIPAPQDTATALPGPSADGVVASLARVKVPEVWALGHRGEGLVLANIDTGVRYTHESLAAQYRGSLPGGGFDHEYHWFDPYNLTAVPRTTGDHGTHTLGTMVGDNGSDRRIGAAPDASWVNCIGFGSFNAGASTTGLLACGQWMLAPTATSGAPETANPALRVDVVNNSWSSCSRSHAPFYDAMIAAWNAAGIASTFSAGNNSNCSYATNPPLGTVGSPSSSGIALAVGSTGNSNGAYATHSNKGPSTDIAPGLPYSAETFGYPDTKPNVVAPGVDVISALDVGDGVYGTMTGTSMSAPLTAGVIALMWDAAPCLRGEVLRTNTILMETATRIAVWTGSPSDGPGNIPNQATGWGEIDALAAIQAAQTFCANGAPPAVSVAVTPSVIALEASSRLTVTLSGHASTPSTLASDFSPALPANLQIADAPNADTTCAGGTVAAAPGAGTFTLSAGAQLPPDGGACAVSVDVRATTPAFYTVTVPANALQTSQGGNAYPATAKLKAGAIFPEPYCENAFAWGISPITRVAFGSIDNASSDAVGSPAHENFLSLGTPVQPGNAVPIRVEGVATDRQFVVAYVDWNQDGVFYADGEAVVVGVLQSSTGLDGQSVTADIPVPADALPGTTRMRVIKRNGGPSLACSRAYAGQSEEYTVVVGSGGTGPTLALALDPPHVAVGGTSRLTLTLSNAGNAAGATLTADLAHALPAGLSVAAEPALDSTCSGAAPVADASGFSLPAGAAIPAHGSCRVSLDVTGTSAGFHTNHIPAGALQTSQGANALFASASLKVGYTFPEPYCRVEYHSAVVPLTRVKFAGIDHRTTGAIMTGLAHEDFTHIGGQVVAGDVVPVHLEFVAFGSFENVASAYFDWNQDNVFDASEAYHLGGLVNSSGDDGKALLGTIQVPVDARPGPTRMRISKHQGGWMTACNANPDGNWNGFGGDGYGQAEDYTITVNTGLAAPAVSTRFTPAMGLVNAESEITTTLSNVNAVDSATTRPFTDTLPTGLQVLGSSTTCAGGTATHTALSVTLGSGATIPAQGRCELRARVRATSAGAHVNTIETGTLTTSTGSNLAPASATYRASDAYTFPEPYCPTFFQFAVYPVTRVAFGGIDHRTPDAVNGSPAHENFVSIEGQVSRGGTYLLTVEARTLDTNDPTNTDHVNVYIDWNMDGSFGADERYFVGHLQATNGIDGTSVSRAITVPADAPLGPTRMRVSKSHEQVREPCAMTGAGQAEDYTLVIDDQPADPQAVVDPGQLTLTVSEGGSVSASFDLANLGPSLLTYDLLSARAAAAGFAAPAGRATALGGAGRIEGAVLRTHLGANEATVTPRIAFDDSQLGQMQDDTPESGNGVACTLGRLNTTTEANSWWRRFYLAEHPVGAQFQVNSVTVASEIGPQIPATVNVYTLPRSVAAESIDRSRLTLVGSGRGTVGGALASSTIPLFNTVVLDADSQDLVVEYAIEGSPHALFMPGGNSTPETHATFLSAAACGIPDPVTNTVLGFPDFHLVMRVDVGEVGAPVLGCDTPSLVSWLSATPSHGDVASGGAQAIGVTADAAALGIGLHQARLCIHTNDPANPRIEVPVSLQVDWAGHIFVDSFESTAD